MAVAADLALGDPVYRAHPVRLMGARSPWIEARAAARSAPMATAAASRCSCCWPALSLAAMVGRGLRPRRGGSTRSRPGRCTCSSLYSLLALGDLLRHVWRVERGRRAASLEAGRAAIAQLVGRDTDRMDAAACRRAAIESLSENLTDGFTSPVFWYVVAGLPGLVLFKVVSTMDSMVGYKTQRYLRFGWCGARLDDAMNYVPARLTWLLMAVVSVVVPGCSARKAFRVGLSPARHAAGPELGLERSGDGGRRFGAGSSGRSGCAAGSSPTSGSATRRIRPSRRATDLVRAIVLVTATGLAAVGLAAWTLFTITAGAGARRRGEERRGAEAQKRGGAGPGSPDDNTKKAQGSRRSGRFRPYRKRVVVIRIDVL